MTPQEPAAQPAEPAAVRAAAPAAGGPPAWRRWLPRAALGVGGAVAAGFVVLVLLALS